MQHESTSDDMLYSMLQSLCTLDCNRCCQAPVNSEGQLRELDAAADLSEHNVPTCHMYPFCVYQQHHAFEGELAAIMYMQCMSAKITPSLSSLQC